MKLISVVLSGGAGTRLWPVSRQALPKPFMKLGGSSLLVQAIERGQACGTDDVLIVTEGHYDRDIDRAGRLHLSSRDARCVPRCSME